MIDFETVLRLRQPELKKVLREEALTRKQFRNFEDCFELFRSRDLRMQSLAITEDDLYSYQFIDVRGEKYKRSEVEAALENTGIPYLEKYVFRYSAHFF